MNEHIKDVVKAVVNDDNVGAMEAIKDAIYSELQDNEEYQALQADIEVYAQKDDDSSDD